MSQIKIVYCKPCGYFDRAESMKRRLEDKFGKNISVNLEAGTHGIFDVYVDGKMVFSRFKEGKFPSAEEIEGSISG